MRQPFLLTGDNFHRENIHEISNHFVDLYMLIYSLLLSFSPKNNWDNEIFYCLY